QFGMWWLAFRQGYLFIPDPVLSNVSDASIEERTLQLLNLIGGNARFLDSRLGEPYFAINFLSHDKWQASDAYTYGKHEDYSAAEIDQIGWTTVLDSWSVLAPRSERERLVAALSQITEPNPLPDLVILPNQAGYDELPGPHVPYRL